jgi:hypothetical protein
MKTKVDLLAKIRLAIETFAMDKHSSLFCRTFNNDKKFPMTMGLLG